MASVEAVAAAATGSGPLRTVGNGGLPTVLLRSSSPREEGGDHAACATATIYLHGATLASWTVDGRELLFVSPGAAFAPPKAIRGGVPVCFPQFGMLGPLATQHGFARNLPWEVLDAGRADASSCTLELRSSEATLALWPHPFCLTMKVWLTATALHQSLRVRNSGAEPLEFTAALHTYLRVSDVSNASVVGLKGISYHDNPTGARGTDLEEAVRFDGGELDRVYLGVPTPLKLCDAGRGPGGGSSGGGSLVMLRQHGFADCVVWSPGEAKAASMADLGSPHYRQFVCVEAAQAHSGSVALAPGQEWEGGVQMGCDTLGES